MARNPEGGVVFYGLDIFQTKTVQRAQNNPLGHICKISLLFFSKIRGTVSSHPPVLWVNYSTEPSIHPSCSTFAKGRRMKPGAAFGLLSG